MYKGYYISGTISDRSHNQHLYITHYIVYILIMYYNYGYYRDILEQITS